MSHIEAELGIEVTMTASQAAVHLSSLPLSNSPNISLYLSSRGSRPAAILDAYLQQHFNFTGMSIEKALRYFCSRFWICGESQQIERILAAFAKRYYDCNRPLHQEGESANDEQREKMIKEESNDSPVTPPTSAASPPPNSTPPNVSSSVKSSEFSTTSLSLEAIHLLTTSLLLLNTDLHNPSNSRKMSKEQFIENLYTANNSLSTTISQSDLREIYASIKGNSLKFPGHSPAGKQPGRANSLFSPISSASSAKTKLAASTTNHTLPALSSSLSQSSLINSNNNNNDTHYISVLCEGLIERKHVLSSADKKASDRSWKSFFAVLTSSAAESTLTLYKPVGKDSLKRLHHHQHHSHGYHIGNSTANSSLAHAGGNGNIGSSTNTSSNFAERFSIRHSLASFLDTSTTKHIFPFSLTLSSGALIYISSPSAADCAGWIAAINNIAAQESAAPLAMPVSSATVSFRPPALPSMRSPYWNDRGKQLEMLKERLDGLQSDLHAQITLGNAYIPPSDNDQDKQNNLKDQSPGKNASNPNVEKPTSSSVSVVLPMDSKKNWEKKLNYLNWEIKKTSIYIQTLSMPK